MTRLRLADSPARRSRPPAAPGGHPGAVVSRRGLLAFAAAAVGLASCSRSPTTAPGGGPAPRAALLAPEEFARRVRTDDRFLVNVHVPDEGTIDGTDAAIAYDALRERRNELPPTQTPLAVFCMTGRMSAEAVEVLAQLGYGDVVELRGGMIAWKEAGFALRPSKPAS